MSFSNHLSECRQQKIVHKVSQLSDTCTWYSTLSDTCTWYSTLKRIGNLRCSLQTLVCLVDRYGFVHIDAIAFSSSAATNNHKIELGRKARFLSKGNEGRRDEHTVDNNSSTSFCLRSSSCRTDLSIHFQPSRPTTI